MPSALRAVEAGRRAERADRRNAQMAHEINVLRRPAVLRPVQP